MFRYYFYFDNKGGLIPLKTGLEKKINFSFFPLLGENVQNVTLYQHFFVKKKTNLSFCHFLGQKKDDLGAQIVFSNTKSKKIKFDEDI